jgi:protein gp37
MSSTSIEWTDHSINPLRAESKVTGARGHYCEKISQGCAHCYSSALQRRFGMPAFGAGQHLDDVKLFLDEAKLQEVLRRKKPTKYFWCDMTDLFGSWVPDAWIDACFATMALTPRHTHQVLTKRPERLRAYLEQVADERDMQRWENAARDLGYTMVFQGDWVGPAWPPPNIWLGVSVESQDQDWRIGELLRCPAAVRFVSAEPLLGPLILHKFFAECECGQGHGFTACPNTGGVATTCDKSGCKQLRPKLGWVIVGGESGHGARPFELDWARAIQNQCDGAEVPWFMKQAGGNARDWDRGDPLNHRPPELVRLRLRDRKGGDLAELPPALRVRQFPAAGKAVP